LAEILMRGDELYVLTINKRKMVFDNELDAVMRITNDIKKQGDPPDLERYQLVKVDTAKDVRTWDLHPYSSEDIAKIIVFKRLWEE